MLFYDHYEISVFTKEYEMKKVINVCALTGNSPCVNVGTNPTITRSKDISHNNRVIGLTVDIGCHEYTGGN